MADVFYAVPGLHAVYFCSLATGSSLELRMGVISPEHNDLELGKWLILRRKITLGENRMNIFFFFFPQGNGITTLGRVFFICKTESMNQLFL